MSRRAIIKALALAAGGGALAAGSASARSRDEDPQRYAERTGRGQIDYADSSSFREEMSNVARAVRATSLMDQNAPPAVKRLAGSATLKRLENGEPAQFQDYRATLDAFEAINPEGAATLRAQFSRLEPQRDRDVDETGMGALGAGAAALAGLALTRGRTASFRRAVMKQLKAGGLGAAGGAAGAAFANDDQATLSGDDAGDIGAWAAGGAALGAGLAGGRSGLMRAVRAAAVRRQRLGQAMPEADGPVFEARATQRAGRTQARSSVPLIERDSDILAQDVFHMERTLDMAGMPRVLTNAKSVEDVAKQLRREADFDGMQGSLDDLETAYRQALKTLGVDQGRAPSLRQIDPYVTDPADRASVDAGVKSVMTRRQRRRKAQRKRRAGEREMRT